ncbi:SGNH/GDSL hydrolase family protein [Leekyejoonella antrihumi]|uniref:SGNH/GDSL hydrolase family protein n=1 Tax=Leekyejoonella antrihumi TaxID=1660198 RepID=A0A563DVK6_9MICO|nr:SGNH/GDSL hydrolase family protein [Leekyejoonella antrihumi]TWP34225.1 SGNH/GDSL hydrolase family protein [Leekyejoonella antrihumi]
MSVYAALGDSYAAGVGAGPSTDSCWRSTAGYPVLVGQALEVSVYYGACTGATVADVEKDQVGGLGHQTAYVSITVGGDDLDFTKVMTEFALPAWMADDSVLDTSLRTLHEQLPGRYADLFEKVRARAPHARVVVAGYPRLFDGVDCNPLTFFSVSEMARLNDAADQVAQVMRESTDKAGFQFVDVRDEFVGHAVCDDPEWIRGASWPLEVSFHPNESGAAAYGRLVTAAFRTGAPVKGAAGSAGLPVECGPCRTTPAPRFRLPDITSQRSLQGARRCGLDPNEVAHLGIRIKDPGGDPAALARLHELDRQVLGGT